MGIHLASLVFGIFIGVGVSALGYVSYHINRLERKAKKRASDYQKERQKIIDSL